MNGRDRLDFRLARLEQRAFGTQTPTAGTDAGVAVASKDIVTRLNELEAALASALPMLSVASDPANTLGVNGQWAWGGSDGDHLWLKIAGTWRQIQ